MTTCRATVDRDRLTVFLADGRMAIDCRWRTKIDRLIDRMVCAAVFDSTHHRLIYGRTLTYIRDGYSVEP